MASSQMFGQIMLRKYSLRARHLGYTLLLAINLLTNTSHLSILLSFLLKIPSPITIAGKKEMLP